MSMVREVWDSLQKKYDTNEAGSKKYAKIAHEIISEGMPLDEQFQVTVITDKLPPLWKDFKNTLRNKTKEFSLESQITRLRIEEEVASMTKRRMR
ncbi:uncharacterized protein E5676_scaffold1970G00390 [Cucumis melo var. makuwa]|nr:uncharacterized protein E5676_scaffold1970G00390 [Cucumis melo var. makuwa]